MKHMRRLICMALMIVTVLSLSVSAFAAEYTFESKSDTEYYPNCWKNWKTRSQIDVAVGTNGTEPVFRSTSCWGFSGGTSMECFSTL